MENIITLADGTEIRDTTILTIGGGLILYARSGQTLGSLFETLRDPERTGTITARQYGEETEYRGYTHLWFVREEEAGLITAGLREENP